MSVTYMKMFNFKLADKAIHDAL